MLFMEHRYVIYIRTLLPAFIIIIIITFLLTYLLTSVLTYLLTSYLFTYLLTYLLIYLLTAIELLLCGSSPYTSTDKTRINTHKRNNTKTQ